MPCITISSSISRWSFFSISDQFLILPLKRSKNLTKMQRQWTVLPKCPGWRCHWDDENVQRQNNWTEWRHNVYRPKYIDDDTKAHPVAFWNLIGDCYSIILLHKGFNWIYSSLMYKCSKTFIRGALILHPSPYSRPHLWPTIYGNSHEMGHVFNNKSPLAIVIWRLYWMIEDLDTERLTMNN